MYMYLLTRIIRTNMLSLLRNSYPVGARIARPQMQSAPNSCRTANGCPYNEFPHLVMCYHVHHCEEPATKQSQLALFYCEFKVRIFKCIRFT